MAAMDWKMSAMCQLIGVISVLSTQTSVMSLGESNKGAAGLRLAVTGQVKQQWPLIEY